MDCKSFVSSECQCSLILHIPHLDPMKQAADRFKQHRSLRFYMVCADLGNALVVCYSSQHVLDRCDGDAAKPAHPASSHPSAMPMLQMVHRIETREGI
jgi:hypothetical protein